MGWRARMQSPAWPKDEILAETDFAARLLWRDLHGIADKEGRLEDRPRWIKAETMPYDDVSADDVVGLLDQLAARDYIRRYTVEGAKFIEIPSFVDTQKPHPREARSSLPAPSEGTYTTRQAQGEPKANQGSDEATPRWPESESESESVPKSESDSVPESDSVSKSESESAAVSRASRAAPPEKPPRASRAAPPEKPPRASRAAPPEKPAENRKLKALARQVLRDHPNEPQDTLIDTLQWIARERFKVEIQRQEAIDYLQAGS